MTEHSKGPWEYEQERRMVVAADGSDVCDVGYNILEDARVNADGQLIASAPTLKAENEAMRAAMLEYREILTTALRASRSNGTRSEVTATEGALLYFGDIFNPFLDDKEQDQ